MEVDTLRKTVSVNKAAELVGVARRTMYYWMGADKVEWVRTPSGSPRIFVDSLFRDKSFLPLSRSRQRGRLRTGSPSATTGKLDGIVPSPSHRTPAAEPAAGKDTVA